MKGIAGKLLLFAAGMSSGEVYIVKRDSHCIALLCNVYREGCRRNMRPERHSYIVLHRQTRQQANMYPLI